MARKYGKKAGEEVRKEMKKFKQGTARSGRALKKVTSREQAVAIGLSKARKKGIKVPKKTTASKITSSKTAAAKKTQAKTPARKRKV